MHQIVEMVCDWSALTPSDPRPQPCLQSAAALSSRTWTMRAGHPIYAGRDPASVLKVKTLYTSPVVLRTNKTGMMFSLHLTCLRRISLRSSSREAAATHLRAYICVALRYHIYTARDETSYIETGKSIPRSKRRKKTHH